MTQDVFISYRRADTSGHAGRISDELERHFGREVTFRDIASIAAGADFVHALDRAIAAARVCIVLIGDTWLSEQLPDGTRRLDAADDHVRREVELALARDGLLVLPVLVEGADMPTAEQLPASLHQLARLQAIELSESRWDYDMAHLLRVLQNAGVAVQAPPRAPRWLWPLLGAVAALLLAVVFYCCGGKQARGVDAYTGLWHLPDGGFWSVREKDDALWVEETHHQSRQVWKRGPADRDGDGLHASLEPVFGGADFRYLHSLNLSDDGQSLIGSVRRSDQQAERSLVLTRTRQ